MLTEGAKKCGLSCEEYLRKIVIGIMEDELEKKKFLLFLNAQKHAATFGLEEAVDALDTNPSENPHNSLMSAPAHMGGTMADGKHEDQQ